MSHLVLAINPGSTSTKIAVFKDETPVLSKTLRHSREDLAAFTCNNEQIPYRRRMIEEALAECGYSLQDMDAFSARGGGQCSHVGGTFLVNELMVHEAYEEKYASHPALLACQIAYQFANETGKPAFMTNSPATDEMDEIARFTGLAGIYRTCYTHALNQKEVARRYAASVDKAYEDLNLIICHIGGGISITAHRHGRMIDTNDILNGDGPMAPNRVGSIPAVDIVDLCYSGKTRAEMVKLIRSQGGLLDHLGTFDALDVEEKIANGNTYAKKIYDAMIYQIAKYVGSMAVALKGKVDQIVLTGGIAHSEYLCNMVEEYVSFIAPVTIMAGEFEMEALAAGACDALENGALEYTGVPIWSEAMMFKAIGTEESSDDAFSTPCEPAVVAGVLG